MKKENSHIEVISLNTFRVKIILLKILPLKGGKVYLQDQIALQMKIAFNN